VYKASRRTFLEKVCTLALLKLQRARGADNNLKKSRVTQTKKKLKKAEIKMKTDQIEASLEKVLGKRGVRH
jgi:hypothetical protein